MYLKVVLEIYWLLNLLLILFATDLVTEIYWLLNVLTFCHQFSN